MYRMQSIILGASIMLMSGHSAIAARGGNSGGENFLNGKPFASLNQKIEINTDTITALSVEVNHLQTQLETLGSQVDANTIAISGALAVIQGLEDGLNILSGEVATLRSNLYDLKFQHEADIANFQRQLDELRTQVGRLSAQLTDLANELAIKVAALEAAIAANSSDIQALTTSVAILSGHVSLVEAEITGLLSRIGLTEQQLVQQQTDLDVLTSALTDLSARLALLEQDGTADEFFLQDTPADDHQGEELADYFRSVNATADSYIYVEGIASQSGAWCSTNAAWYVENYLAHYNGSGTALTSGNWQKWSTPLDGNWTATNASHRNYHSNPCDGTSGSWCSEWGIGGQYIAYLPNRYSNQEVYNSGSTGNGSLRIRVSSTRSAACGF